MSAHRRRFLTRIAQTTTIASLPPSLVQLKAEATKSVKSKGLFVRSRRPLDLETPVDKLDSEFTPNEWFFVRSHFGEPAVNMQGWSVAFDGLFQKPEKLSLNDIFSRFPRHERPAVLMCAGNGRALMKPIVPGLPWERGAVGQAVWSGVRLKDVVEGFGLKPNARHLVFETGDPVPSKATPPFHRSVPLERLMQEDVLLADRMNDQPLPLLHGGPLRLVVPTWTGNHWVKWIVRITASAEEGLSDFQRKSYKMPKLELPPSVTPTPEQLSSVTTLNVKSQLTWPLAGEEVPGQGPITIRGSAWTGPGVVTQVHVRTNLDNEWKPAEIVTKNPVRGAWVRWQFSIVNARPGEVAVETRATDSVGLTQPERPFWNRSGYLYNAIERVSFNVTA